MNSPDVQLTLVQSLLAAPGSLEGWREFLRQLCDAFHGSAANFISHSMDSGQANVSITARTDERAVQEYQRRWSEHDPWRNASRGLLEPGAVIIGDAVIDRGQFARTAFYNDFAQRYGIGQCIAGVLELSPEALSNVSVNRPAGAARFNTPDAELFRSLIPHIKRAIDIHRRLSGAELMAAHASAVLERLPHGVILVARNGAVIATNRAADAIIRARDGLTIEHGGLRAASPSVTARLHRALNIAVRTREGETLDANTAVALPRPSGHRPLSLLVAPLPGTQALLANDGAAIAVFISDPDQIAAPDVDTIRVLFDLTRAESELVRCIVAGLSLEETAARLGLKVQTLRTRLKVVFQKTNTHRQAELVRFVLTSAAGLT